MATLTINPERQLTLSPDLVEHLGQPGDQVEVSFSQGNVTLSRPRPTLRGTKSWKEVAAELDTLWAGRTNVKLTIEQMDEAIGQAVAELDRDAHRS